MAIVYTSDGVYVGLSTDTKPVSPAGYRFFETNTGDWQVSDGTYWWISSLGALSNRRWGFIPVSTGLTVGVGMLTAVVSATGTGGVTSVLTDTTNGRYINYPISYNHRR